ncbi:MAG: thiamine pyrophosphate-dependent dehydrogenase E1 component subunit alpha [Magnetovibrionaceae bacterium]
MTEDANQDVVRLYTMLYRVRRVEEEVARVYPSDKIKSPVHLSIGQEALSVGVCDVLREDDVVSGSYRGHAAYLAKGGSVKAMVAEMYGKATGCAGGKGGSMHLIGPDCNVMGASAVVGTHIPIAAGHAMANKMRGQDNVVVVFMGDGATEEGAFAETLNFASLKKLPVLFVCENNFYAIHEPLEKRWATAKLCDRVQSYGIPAERIEDGDIFKIRDAAERAVEAMRAGEGPRFLELWAYRWREHVGPNEDFDQGYRDKAEAEFWMKNDQVPMLAEMLDSDARKAIEDEIEAEVAEAFAFAEQSPPPPIEDLYAHVYAD